MCWRDLPRSGFIDFTELKKVHAKWVEENYPLWSRTQTGYFADKTGRTKAHIVYGPGLAPVCGSRVKVRRNFVVRAQGVYLPHVECQRCHHYFVQAQKAVENA